MAWDEWEQLKAAAAERSSVSTRINQLDAGSGSGGGPGTGPGGRLHHSPAPWNRAAATAGELRTATTAAKARLTAGHSGMAGGLTGLGSLGALTSALESWEKRLTAVGDECAALGPALRQASRELGGTDRGVGAQVGSVPAPRPRDRDER
ncbi:amino acid ABC transporter permease [Streptomyces sp. NPDC047097]|uniref:amino acid ABC transporter permease n=1 Tax=Streptomyces sp. NPDC047097 TaxID=3155260 RepID=UPI0033FEB933